MFNLLFDRFVKCDTLRKYYQRKTRFPILKDNKEITEVRSSLLMHSPTIFDDDGELKRPNIFDDFARYIYSRDFADKNNPSLLELVLEPKEPEESTNYKKYIKYKLKYLKLRNKFFL